MKTKLESFFYTNGMRMVMLLVCYSACLLAARYLAFQLRFDFELPPQQWDQLILHWHWVLALKLLLLFIFGQFSGLLSYFSLPDARKILYATALATLFLAFIKEAFGPIYNPPRSVLLIDWVLSFSGLVAIRLAFRVLRQRMLSPMKAVLGGARRVGIVGAGDVGASLARELFAKRGLGLQPVVFYDDDARKKGSSVHGVPVVGPPECILNARLSPAVQELIIAMPSASAKRIGEVVRLAQQVRVRVEIVPSLDQLATGKVKVTQLRKVEIQDLLGRDPVHLETRNILHVLTEKAVLVTGAGGSIGSELCRQIAIFKPSRLLLLDQSEVQLFAIEQELVQLGYSDLIVPLIGDVLDMRRMIEVFEHYQPEIIFHAAAHKHVPLMEHQPGEAIKNNAAATGQLAELAREFEVERFVLISSDKAINPTNVMGATKRLAELLVQSIAAHSSGATRFMAVRFGNVLGSSGSVVPIFQKQIAAGGPVRVTHPEVTRYFMTIPEAAGLVLQSCSQGEGGEIFVLDMGSPVRIVDLARSLIELNGFRPETDIEIEFTGLRPGEKLFEELSYRGEKLAPTRHAKIMRFQSEPLPFDVLQKNMRKMMDCLHTTGSDELKLILKGLVKEYVPQFSAGTPPNPAHSLEPPSQSNDVPSPQTGIERGE
jgi:FlaA1/EpsC-like NDP-sugar epimerase